MSENADLTISGLQLIDYRELEEQLPSNTIRQLSRPARHSGQHGQLGLITATIELTAEVVHKLSAWLAQRDSQETEGQGFTVTVDPGNNIMIRLGASAVTSDDVKGGLTSQSEIQNFLEETLKTVKSLESS